MIWLLYSSVQAAPALDGWARQAPVTLEARGVQRIHVPMQMHDNREPLTQDTLMLVDGRGEVVPIAFFKGGERWRTTSVAKSTNPKAVAAVSPVGANQPNVFELVIREQPRDGLRITLDEQTYAVTAVLRNAEGAELGRTLLWRLGGNEPEGMLPLPRELGTFTVELLNNSGELLTPSFTVLDRRASHVPDETVVLQPTASTAQENDWARYDFHMDHPYPIQSIELDVVDDLYRRSAGVLFTESTLLPGRLPEMLWPEAQSTIERVDLAGTQLEQDRLTVQGEGEDFAVLIQADENQPLLELAGVRATFPGVHILVRDPGEGPFTLYAGGAHRGGASDLQFAAAELDRLTTGLIEAGEVVANPVYVPPESRGGLGEPGRVLDAGRFRYERPVTGPAGLVRLPFDDTVLDHAVGGLDSVRLLANGDRQIPYVLRPDQGVHTWGELPFTTEERGGKTIVKVPLPKANVEVGAVTLSTSAPIFHRKIEIARVRGPRLETLRAVHWAGRGEPGSLTLAVHQKVGEELVIVIDNGDDPPLPLDSVRVDWIAWEALFVLPEGGATLVYGHPTIGAPSYDLKLLSANLGSRATALAVLGPESPRTRAKLTSLDRAMLGAGIGVMGLGLLGLLLLLLRGAPADAKPPAEPRSSDDGPDDVPPPVPPASDTESVDSGSEEGAGEEEPASSEVPKMVSPPAMTVIPTGSGETLA